MRVLPGFMILLAASCAPQPAAPPAPVAVDHGVQFFDQGWSAADRQAFVSTRQGSHVMPPAWFTALHRTDADAPFAADQLARYGYLPTPTGTGGGTLPVGFVADGTPDNPQLGMTCAACHTGQLNIGGVPWRIDGGRAGADFQAFLTDLSVAARATRDDAVRFNLFASSVLGPSANQTAVQRLQQDFADWTARYSGFMAASLPNPAWGPGRLDAFGMIFNRVTGLDLARPDNLVKADAPVRYPFIWDAPRQDHTQWTGAAPNGTYLRGLARNTGEVFGVFGEFDPKPLPAHLALYVNSVNLQGLQTLEEKVVALRAPKWPSRLLPLDAAQASHGAGLFQTECAGCHGIKPSPLVSGAWATTVTDAGTDRRTYENSKRLADSGVLASTQQPPLVGKRLADPAPRLSILANAVVGSLLHGINQHNPAIPRAIGGDFAEGRLPMLDRPTNSSPGPGAAAADVRTATQDLYRLPGAKADVPAGITPTSSVLTGAPYEARVLTGIWAVGPYLHNGSVPSLWELLKPARQRMKRFAVGHRDFDPVNVGLDTAPGPGRQIFTVSPDDGNGNAGHEYGTALPEVDRRALLEYLKTL